MEHQKPYKKINRYKDDVPADYWKDYEEYLDQIEEAKDADCKPDNNKSI